ncbi:hypothetical protein GY31_03345 [Lysinibacillus sphaericus]|uniref:hypothetical protein n=1 Tax=Lysinibacillus TaxID=400634 RepID=UPI00084B5C3B|nr:hypothetical protein [Lysinibacillus sphaericus]OEC03154.1 hypothetical protein GY31_03345 [Lysinibacillus sphaericus]
MPEQIKLGELQPGKMFKRGDTYGFKSEYRNEKGICECYIIGSGEMFWGGTGNPNNLKVEPIDFNELMKDIEMLNKIKNEADELYAEEIDLSDFGERVSNII